MSVNNNAQVGSGRIRSAKFTASGSWTAPAGVFSIQALAVGGGGGGGASKSTTTSTVASGGGGGGGGVVDSMFPVVPGTTYTVTIGTGGAGANGSAAASNGTNTTFGSLFTAPGGQGGSTNIYGTSYKASSNPGGSMGGFGNFQSGYHVYGHGSGAATAPYPIAASNAFAVSDIITATNFSYNNGYGIVNVPCIQIYEVYSPGVVEIGLSVTTNTTYYAGVKRTESVHYPAASVCLAPGLSWKGLGAGGASVVNDGPVTNRAQQYIHPNLEPAAGLVKTENGFTLDGGAASSNYNGTNGQANSGAGGGGSSAGSSNTIATGGTGGSGYVEILWAE